MTIAEAGCSFDFGPPSAPEPNRGGPPPEERIKAEQFIREALASVNDRTWNDLRAEWVKAGGKPKTFGRAVDEMKEAGILATDGGPGMGKQMTLHLINPEAGAEPEAAEPDPDQPF